MHGDNSNGKRVDRSYFLFFEYVEKKMKIKHINEKCKNVICNGSNLRVFCT